MEGLLQHAPAGNSCLKTDMLSDLSIAGSEAIGKISLFLNTCLFDDIGPFGNV